MANAQVPDALHTKLKFIRGFQLTIPDDGLSTNSGAVNGLYVNDPFDPDFGIGNDAAQGFDFWRDYYNNYIVTRADIRVKFQNNSQVRGLIGYVQPQYGTGPIGLLNGSPINTIQAFPRMRFCTMSQASAGRNIKVIKTNWSIRKDGAWLPRSNTWETSGFSAGVSSSPANRRQVNIWIGTDNGVANSGQILSASVIVQCIYHCRFYNRRNTPELLDPE